MDSNYYSIIMLVAMFALLYFFMIRPENKRKKEAQNLRDSLAVGDVVTVWVLSVDEEKKRISLTMKKPS